MSRMRHSMAELTPQYSADRAVREYTEQHYLAGAEAYRQRAAEKGAAGRAIVDWKRGLESHWEALRFAEVRVETHDGRHIFEVRVDLDGLDRGDVVVEVYADGTGPFRQAMQAADGRPGVYRAEIPAERPATDFTVRVIPQRAGVAVPLEAGRILWQR